MAEKFVPRHSIASEIGRKNDQSMFGRDFLQKFASSPESRLEFLDIPVGEIVPRSINRYRQSRIEELAASIKNTNNRLIHPIVVMRISDLKTDSEVYKAYISDSTDLSGYKYIIVSGERRYRAWLLLRQRESELLKNRLGADNPFDTITANVLTSFEAANENAFYSDANNLARHLSPAEAVWFIRDALSEVSDAPSKRDALIRMNGGSDVGIDPDPALAAKKFRVDNYIAFLLENEYGINDWSAATLRNLATVALNCDTSVCDALLAGSFPLREARRIATLPTGDQQILLSLYQTDISQYQDNFEFLKRPEPAPKKKAAHSDTRKHLRATVKRLKSERKEIEKIAESIGSKYNRNELDVLRKYDAFIVELTELIEKTK